MKKRDFIKALAASYFGLGLKPSLAFSASMTDPDLVASGAYEWLPTECADERAPMQLIYGELHFGEGGSVSVPAAKIVNNGWGEIGSRRLIGNPVKPVPQRFSAAWFSYTEDCFFEGSLELPHAKINKMFAEGFREPLTGKWQTWDKIIVGMGLGGWVSVWLSGSGLVQEVASAKLNSADLDWRRVVDNPGITRQEFILSKLKSRLSSEALQAIAENGPPAPTFPLHSRPLCWRIHAEGLHKPLHMFLRSFNGDRHFFDFQKQPPGQLERAPKRMQITWMGDSGRKLLTKINLDEAEVFDAFQQAGAADLARSGAALHIEFGARSQVRIGVDGGQERVELDKSKVEVLSLA